MSTPTIPNITLRRGTAGAAVEMPQLGFGVFQVPDGETTAAVATALEAGYRSIDTAAVYGNEAGVGRAIAGSAVARDELFVTTKLWIDSLGTQGAREGLEASLERLGLEQVDLFLIHWPAPATDAYLAAWEGMQEVLSAGLTRAIGVSNFLPEHLDKVVALGGEWPAVNQIELHPALQNAATVARNDELDIRTEAWSPLGQGTLLADPAVRAVAEAHDVTPAQAILRWHIQRGNIVIPKSVTPERIVANLDVFGFELDAPQVAALDALESNGRKGPHPAEFNG